MTAVRCITDQDGNGIGIPLLDLGAVQALDIFATPVSEPIDAPAVLIQVYNANVHVVVGENPTPSEAGPMIWSGTERIIAISRGSRVAFHGAPAKAVLVPLVGA